MVLGGKRNRNHSRTSRQLGNLSRNHFDITGASSINPGDSAFPEQLLDRTSTPLPKNQAPNLVSGAATYNTMNNLHPKESQQAAASRWVNPKFSTRTEKLAHPTQYNPIPPQTLASQQLYQDPYTRNEYPPVLSSAPQFSNQARDHPHLTSRLPQSIVSPSDTRERRRNAELMQQQKFEQRRGPSPDPLFSRNKPAHLQYDSYFTGNRRPDLQTEPFFNGNAPTYFQPDPLASNQPIAESWNNFQPKPQLNPTSERIFNFEQNPPSRSILKPERHNPTNRGHHYTIPINTNSRAIDKHKHLDSISPNIKRRAAAIHNLPPAMGDDFGISNRDNVGFGPSLPLVHNDEVTDPIRKQPLVLEFQKAKQRIIEQQARIEQLEAMVRNSNKLPPPTSVYVTKQQSSKPAVTFVQQCVNDLSNTPRSNETQYRSKLILLKSAVANLTSVLTHSNEETIQAQQLKELQEKYKEACEASKIKDKYIHTLESVEQKLQREVSLCRSGQQTLQRTQATLHKLGLQLDEYITKNNIPATLITLNERDMETFVAPGSWPHRPLKKDTEEEPSISAEDDLGLIVKDQIERIIRFGFNGRNGLDLAPASGIYGPRPNETNLGPAQATSSARTNSLADLIGRLQATRILRTNNSTNSATTNTNP